jgi:hypothetical protein
LLEVYREKTQRRISEYLRQDPSASRYWVETDGQKIGLPQVVNELDEFVQYQHLTQNSTLMPIHGDLCFSNLLYDTRLRQIKLIDPRGEFGIPGIYGDQHYDLAKLLHSYSGGYDFIVSDRFKVSVTHDFRLDCQLLRTNYHQQVTDIMNGCLMPDMAQLQHCKAIEALLFLSMLPLHKDRPDRQRAMLAVGLGLFRQVMKKEPSCQ